MKPARIAFVGKGGAGKSVIAGTFARLLGRRGVPVLAVDSDPMPGLGFSVGLPGVATPLPDDALEDGEPAADGRPGPPRLRLHPVEAAERYAAAAPDGVRFLQFGKLRGHVSELRRSQVVFHLIVDGIRSEQWHVVGDLPGGTRQPFFGWGDFADTIVVVAEPTSASLLTARRLAHLATSDEPPGRLVVVANKVRDGADVGLVAVGTGLDVIGAVPADTAVRKADRTGQAVLDLAPDCDAVRAVQELVARLVPEALMAAPHPNS